MNKQLRDFIVDLRDSLNELPTFPDNHMELLLLDVCKRALERDNETSAKRENAKSRVLRGAEQSKIDAKLAEARLLARELERGGTR